MAIKIWKVKVDYLFGFEITYTIEANTEHKARQFALEKVRKEKKCDFAYVLSCDQIHEKENNE